MIECISDSFDYVPAYPDVSNTFGEFFPFHELQGMTAKHISTVLQSAETKLGTTLSAELWKAEPENAEYVCATLLQWAEQRQEGIWQV